MRSLKMKTAMISAVLAVFTAVSAFAVEIKVEKIPGNEKEFLELRDRLSSTPEGGAAVFLVAMLAFSEDQKLGMKFFTIALDKNNLSEGNVYKGYKPDSGVMYHIERLADPKRKRTPYSYISGTVSDDGYAASLPYVFVITTNKYSVSGEGRVKVFVECSGAAYPRPISMRKNDKNIWKAYEISSMSLDVPMPSPNDKDDL